MTHPTSCTSTPKSFSPTLKRNLSPRIYYSSRIKLHHQISLNKLLILQLGFSPLSLREANRRALKKLQHTATKTGGETGNQNKLHRLTVRCQIRASRSSRHYTRFNVSLRFADKTTKKKRTTYPDGPFQPTHFQQSKKWVGSYFFFIRSNSG